MTEAGEGLERLRKDQEERSERDRGTERVRAGDRGEERVRETGTGQRDRDRQRDSRRLSEQDRESGAPSRNHHQSPNWGNHGLTWTLGVKVKVGTKPAGPLTGRWCSVPLRSVTG